MAQRRSRTRDEQKALHAKLARSLGRKSREAVSRKQLAKDLRLAATRQRTTQKFIKLIAEKGVIAHPNALIKGNPVYALIVDPNTKGRHTKGDKGWVFGKVMSKGKRGNTPAVKIRWDGVDDQRIYTGDDMRNLSIITLRKSNTKKSGAQIALEAWTRKRSADMRKGQRAESRARAKGLNKLRAEFGMEPLKSGVKRKKRTQAQKEMSKARRTKKEEIAALAAEFKKAREARFRREAREKRKKS